MVTVYLSAKRSDAFHSDTYKDTGELLGLIPPASPRIRPDFAELMTKPAHKIVRNYLQESAKPKPPVSQIDRSIDPRFLVPHLYETPRTGSFSIRFRRDPAY